jgi:hypothetical protein
LSVVETAFALFHAPKPRITGELGIAERPIAFRRIAKSQKNAGPTTLFRR